jgi:hypothetical protein
VRAWRSLASGARTPSARPRAPSCIAVRVCARERGREGERARERERERERESERERPLWSRTPGPWRSVYSQPPCSPRSSCRLHAWHLPLAFPASTCACVRAHAHACVTSRVREHTDLAHAGASDARASYLGQRHPRMPAPPAPATHSLLFSLSHTHHSHTQTHVYTHVHAHTSALRLSSCAFFSAASAANTPYSSAPTVKPAANTPYSSAPTVKPAANTPYSSAPTFVIAPPYTSTPLKPANISRDSNTRWSTRPLSHT